MFLLSGSLNNSRERGLCRTREDDDGNSLGVLGICVSHKHLTLLETSYVRGRGWHESFTIVKRNKEESIVTRFLSVFQLLRSLYSTAERFTEEQDFPFKQMCGKVLTDMAPLQEHDVLLTTLPQDLGAAALTHFQHIIKHIYLSSTSV
jgi:hypothetical protein